MGYSVLSKLEKAHLITINVIFVYNEVDNTEIFRGLIKHLVVF